MPTPNHTYVRNGTIIDQAVHGVVGLANAMASDDHKMATLIVFTLFIVILMVITIKKECSAADRRAEYQKATAQGEGIELVVADEITADV